MRNVFKRTIFVLLLATLISVTVQPASALWNISGYVNRSDTGTGISGVVVYNTSNSSMTSTTDANGWYKITGYDNNSWGHNITATGANGFRDSVNTTIVMSETDKYGNITYLIITPSTSGVTESGLTKSTVTIAWTANDSYVGNMLKYSQDSALGTNVFDTAWLNSTTAASFKLENLLANTKYYYTVYTYNKANSSYVGTADGDFTTSKAGTVSYYNPTTGKYEYGTQTTTTVLPKEQTIVQQITAPNNRPKVLFFVVIIIAIIAYSQGWLTNSGRRPRNKK